MSITYITSRAEITSTPPRHSLEDSFITGDIRFRKYYLFATSNRGGSDCSVVAFAFAEDLPYLEANLRMLGIYKSGQGTETRLFDGFLVGNGYQKTVFLFRITLGELWQTGFFRDDHIIILGLYDEPHDEYHSLAYRRVFFGDFLPDTHIVKCAYIKQQKENTC